MCKGPEVRYHDVQGLSVRLSDNEAPPYMEERLLLNQLSTGPGAELPQVLGNWFVQHSPEEPDSSVPEPGTKVFAISILTRSFLCLLSGRVWGPSAGMQLQGT